MHNAGTVLGLPWSCVEQQGKDADAKDMRNEQTYSRHKAWIEAFAGELLFW